MKIVICNHKIRDILSNGWLIGVVGNQKCGKSSFIQKIIPGADANASASAS
jgi:hypothetical protein